MTVDLELTPCLPLPVLTAPGQALAPCETLQWSEQPTMFALPICPASQRSHRMLSRGRGAMEDPVPETGSAVGSFLGGREGPLGLQDSEL